MRPCLAAKRKWDCAPQICPEVVDSLVAEEDLENVEEEIEDAIGCDFLLK